MSATKMQDDDASHSAVPTARSSDSPATGSEKDLESGWTTDVPTKEAEEHQDNDPNLITWDGPDDPENPQNWSFRRKLIIVSIVSAITFIRYAPASSFLLYS